MPQLTIDDPLPCSTSTPRVKPQTQHDNASLWHASLNLGFRQLRDKTVLLVNKHRGPLRVQRPFYPENNGRCHCYILHPPGGVVGGDRLEIRSDHDVGTSTLVTTPGAGKFYRSPNKQGVLLNTINIGEQASVDWLPQETIFFNGASAKLSTRINLCSSSTFVAWDIACLGRPAAQEQFKQGSIDQSLQVFVNHQPLFLDRIRVEQDRRLFESRCGWNGRVVNATLLANAITAQDYKDLQGFNEINAHYELSVTLLGDLLVVRYLGDSAEQARQRLLAMIKEIKRRRGEDIFVEPRIWLT
jgi:urease accessory protein